jgi:hypothetical protein
MLIAIFTHILIFVVERACAQAAPQSDLDIGRTTVLREDLDLSIRPAAVTWRRLQQRLCWLFWSSGWLAVPE